MAQTNPRSSPPTPGDNRGPGDVDGNAAGGASKATGPKEPKPAVEKRDGAADRNTGDDRGESHEE